MKRELLLFGLFVLTLIALLLFNVRGKTPHILRIGEVEIKIELVTTSEERAKGLSGLESMPENQGMLFVFDKSDYYSFWMKDMNFAIDIIWIDEDKKIIDITHNADPQSYPQTFTPRLRAQYVLEVNAGWAKERGVEIGDLADFTLSI